MLASQAMHYETLSIRLMQSEQFFENITCVSYGIFHLLKLKKVTGRKKRYTNCKKKTKIILQQLKIAVIFSQKQLQFHEVKVTFLFL